jgi:hypothetical protein
MRMALGLLAASAWAQDDSSSDGVERALGALRILGAEVEGSSHRCSSCHALSMVKLRDWSDTSLDVYYRCLKEHLPADAPQQLGPRERVDCLRSVRGDATAPFTARRLGIYAAGAHLPRFQAIFRAAYPEGEWQAQYQAFVDAVQMPSTGEDLIGEPEFEQLISWTIDRMPALERVVGTPGDPPSSCTDSRTPRWQTHVERMQLEGWSARNVERGMIMFGCAPEAASPLDCFTQVDGRSNAPIFPEAKDTSFGRDWLRDLPAAKLRILRDISQDTAYWMRSSPDGRFFASGTDAATREPQRGEADSGFHAMISDLQTQLTGEAFRDIPVKADYDPAFFPDNSGFMFQSERLGAGMCSQSLLESPLTAYVDFTQAECSTAGNIHLYQSVGASLGGSDYLAAAGAFEEDRGRGVTARDREPLWLERAYLRVTPIVHDGRVYQARDTVNLWTPWLGDHTLAHSGAALASRISGLDAGGQPRQQGYRFSLVSRRLTPEGPSFVLEEGATVCLDGNKGDFSYDERYYTVYHYVDADDWRELGFPDADAPEFKQLLASGASNVYVVDLLTGEKQRVTRMGAGQFALFPHFRSDGWLYFMVLDRNLQKRFVAATDVTLRRKS